MCLQEYILYLGPYTKKSPPLGGDFYFNTSRILYSSYASTEGGGVALPLLGLPARS